MKAIEASAPGKLVLVGEYAVLEGGTAISAAVDERAIARIRPIETDRCELHINNTGEKFVFSIGPGGAPQWHSQPGHLGLLLEIALKQITGHGGPATPFKSFAITLCTQDFYTSGPQETLIKTGIGSSAALTVALTAALQSYLEQEPTFEVCNHIHHSFQHGKGSGIDVVTSWHGGVVAMQKGGRGEMLVSQLEWPSGLQVLPVWTGIPTSTPDLLDRFAVYRGQSPGAYRGLLEQLCVVSDRALACWQEDNVAAFIGQIKNYADLLKELDEAAQIGIWSDVHRTLEAVATEYGASYKPSGAGGGDYGLIFAFNNEQLHRLKQQLGNREPADLETGWTNRGLELTNSAGIS